MARDPYNTLVLELFSSTTHAGDLAGDYAQTVCAKSAEKGGGSEITMAAGIAEGKLAEIRFRVLGCPHLIAALEASCRRMVGEPIEVLRNPDVELILSTLSVPAEKTGRILLIQDICRKLHHEAVPQ